MCIIHAVLRQACILSFGCSHEASIPFLFPRQGIASSEHHLSPVFSEGCLLMKYDASTEDYNLKHVVFCDATYIRNFILLQFRARPRAPIY